MILMGSSGMKISSASGITRSSMKTAGIIPSCSGVGLVHVGSSEQLIPMHNSRNAAANRYGNLNFINRFIFLIV